MSYQAHELSEHDGEAVELYRFALGPDVYAYTSADEPFTHGGTVYQPEAGLSRSQIEVSEELSRQALTVEVARDNELAALWLPYPPMVAAQLTIYRGHRGDADAEFVTYWRGRIASVSWTGSRATITCQSALAGARRLVFVPHWSVGCRHGLYGPGCEVARAAFGVDGSITLVDGAALEAAAWAGYPDGWFAGGFVEVGSTPQRLVVSHVGARLNLQAAVAGIGVGDVVRAYAGCDHSSEDCDLKFGNLENFGGCEYFPKQNPFDGKVV